VKKCGLWLGLLAASAAGAWAQVSVEVTQEQEQFLPGEALSVAVRITNRSGQPLHLGAEQDWLTFGIESREGSVVSKTGDAPVAGEFVLESSKIATKHVDLAPYFAFTQPGRYGVVATVWIKDWRREVISAPKFFNIINGSKLWDQEVGVPPPADAATNSVPEVRHYILQQANYLKGQLRLYLRITDSYGRTFRVFPVGPLVSFSHPIPQVDKASNLHLLYQDGPFTYHYSQYNLDGDVLARQTYDYADTRPRLRIDDDGKIGVVGGIRRVTAEDVPPPPPTALTNDVSNSSQTQGVPPPYNPKADKKKSKSKSAPAE
jgi:hypothetical protein